MKSLRRVDTRLLQDTNTTDARLTKVTVIFPQDLDCEQSLFCSKIRWKNAKIAKKKRLYSRSGKIKKTVLLA